MATTSTTAPTAEKDEALDLDLIVLVPPPPHPMPRFYIAGVSATYNPTALATLQLTHLVSIGAEPGKILASRFQPGHISLSLPDILDVEEQDLLSSLLPSLLPFLASTTPADSILVHCQAGQSRSVAAVLMYLMIFQEMTLVEAHAQVARSRPGVCVNSGFLRQLLFLEDFSGLHAYSQRDTERGIQTKKKEEHKSLPSALSKTNRHATNTDLSRKSARTSSFSWAAEHRLYLLSHLFRATCRLSSLDPLEIEEKIKNEHNEIIRLLTKFGRANFSGPPEKKEEEGGGKEEVGGWVAHCRHCRQVLCTEKDAVRHTGVEIDELKRRTRACVREIAEVVPAAGSVWEYERGFERQPVLHLLPLSHSIVKSRKKENAEREVKRRKLEKGGKEEGGGEGAEEDSITTCHYRCVYPPQWVLPSLLASEGGGGNGGAAGGSKKGKKNGGGGGGREGGMASIRCPGRHCGAVVGSMQARPQEGGREGGEVCECLEALPLVVVKFGEEALVIERVEEKGGGREGGKEG